MAKLYNITMNKEVLKLIEDKIKNTFSDIDIIKEIYIRPSPRQFLIILIHDPESISIMVEKTTQCLSKFEDEFPDVYFETWDISTKDMDTRRREIETRDSKLIFKR